MRAQVGIGEDHVDARVREDKAYFIRFQEIVDWDRYRTAVQNAEQGGDEFRTIFEPKADAIAGLHIELLSQHAGDKKRLSPNFRVRERALAPEQRGFFRVLLDRVGKRTGQVHDVTYYKTRASAPSLHDGFDVGSGTS